MNAFSEEELRKKCPHCDPQSFALKHPLQETDRFWVVCDVHPLTKGHILIIPKEHISCIGEYPPELYREFVYLYTTYSYFLERAYGSVASFEHGKIGQTVFHSHVQMFPYEGSEELIIPEGEEHILPIESLDDLKSLYQKQGAYLYFSIGEKMWSVDIALGAPRFFRDRFARALNHPERGNWKEMHDNPEIMMAAEKDIAHLLNKWHTHSEVKYR